jgi:hypothetical protein
VLITCYRHSADILLPAPAGKIFMFFKNVAQQQNGGNLFFLLKRKGEREQIATLANCS